LKYTFMKFWRNDQFVTYMTKRSRNSKLKLYKKLIILHQKCPTFSQSI
jgi:hypothetical protein